MPHGKPDPDQARDIEAGDQVMAKSIQSMGGAARAERLSPQERSGIASAAAKARWENEKDYNDFCFPLVDGRKATLRIPKDMGAPDWDLVMRTFALWKQALNTPRDKDNGP